MGRIRIDLERAYRDAGVRTILLRAGDFLDTEPSGNWFDQIMTKSLAKGRFVYPGNPDVPHAWAYLPDVANAAVALAAQRASLPQFCDVPFPGYQVTGREMAEALRRVMGQEVTLRSMSWLPLQLASPVWRFARLLLEMRYLWDKPHGLSPDRFDELVPEFRATPFDVALSRATRHIQPEVSGARRIRVQAS